MVDPAKEVQQDLFGQRKLLEQYRFKFRGIKEEMFWDEAEERLLESLQDYAKQASDGLGYSRRLFAEDARAQGFAFIDLMQKQYDVVLMNPPFGAGSAPSKGYIDSNYPRTKNDVYAAFIERWVQKLTSHGRIGAITSRTGFFLTTFQKWREEIILKETRPVL